MSVIRTPEPTEYIQGSSYTYNPFIVIEGKHLPTPGKNREREYVSGVNGPTGRIQRFKLGRHGAEHETAIIVGYIQRDNPADWLPTVNQWITYFSERDPSNWRSTDELLCVEISSGNEKMKSSSEHSRTGNCKINKIKILHLWIKI